MTGIASAPALGALLGLLASLGTLLAVSRVPAMRRPTLDDRLAPYLRDAPPGSRLLQLDRTVTPFPTLERIVAPVITWLRGASKASLAEAPACAVDSSGQAAR